tara:strand:+ start:8407 stop:8724 length:318 start_codon:yes stop_codon:yes gene_type:complete
MSGVALGGQNSPVTSLDSIRKVSTTPGTAVQLKTDDHCIGAIIQALSTNTNLIAIGGAAVIAGAGTETGTLLAAGAEITIYNKDMDDIYLDVITSGEGVSINVIK